MIGSCRATGNVRAGQEEMCYFQLFVDLHVGLVCVGLHVGLQEMCRGTCRLLSLVCVGLHVGPQKNGSNTFPVVLQWQ